MSHSQEPTNQPTGDKDAQHDLLGELSKLGQQLEQATRAALESEQAKSFQRDLSAGMKEFFGQMQNAARSVQEDNRVRDLTDRGQQAISELQEKVQDNRTVNDFQETMARGIAYLNSQLAEFSERLEAEKTQESTGAQQVPIEEEKPAAVPPTPTAASPSTGPTVRLDEETRQ